FLPLLPSFFCENNFGHRTIIGKYFLQIGIWMLGNYCFLTLGMLDEETLHIKKFLLAFPINGAQRFVWNPLFKNYHIVIKPKLNIRNNGFHNSTLFNNQQSILFFEFAQKLAALIHIQPLYRIV